MAKYIGSPWGQILGKLNGSVGGKWKGINWVRVLVHPTQRGTLVHYRLYKDGLEGIPPFSFPQMNIRRLATQVLGYLARVNLTTFINVVWQDFINRHPSWNMTASNAFVKYNASTLYNSMTDTSLEFDPTTNTPDLKVIKIAEGDLEPTGEILTAVYTTGTGALALTWNVNCYTNGLATDVTSVVVLKKPILESIGRDGTWMPQLYMYGPLAAGTRASGTGISIVLPTGLTPADLTVFVFFKDSLSAIGYSISASHAVVGP